MQEQVAARHVPKPTAGAEAVRQSPEQSAVRRHRDPEIRPQAQPEDSFKRCFHSIRPGHSVAGATRFTLWAILFNQLGAGIGDGFIGLKCRAFEQL